MGILQSLQLYRVPCIMSSCDGIIIVAHTHAHRARRAMSIRSSHQVGLLFVVWLTLFDHSHALSSFLSCRSPSRSVALLTADQRLTKPIPIPHRIPSSRHRHSHCPSPSTQSQCQQQNTSDMAALTAR